MSTDFTFGPSLDLFLVNIPHFPDSPIVDYPWKLLLLYSETLDSVVWFQKVGIFKAVCLVRPKL